MPDARMRTYKVQRVVEHTPILKSLYFEAKLDARPGQFLNLWLPGVDERPFSISDLADGQIEITVKAIGPFTQRLMDVRVGEWLGLRGPYGSAFGLRDEGLLVGGGIGFAPLRFLARRLRETGRGHRVLIGVKSRSDLLFPKQYETAELMSQDGSIGGQGLVTDRLRTLLEQAPPRVIYGAGPEPMLLAIRELANQHRVPFELSFERYMKCGVGLCGACCLDGNGVRVCVEGPVFTERQLEGVTELGLPHRTATGGRP